MLKRLYCRIFGHDPKPTTNDDVFTGGITHHCWRCGAVGSSFEFCPSTQGDTTIYWGY